MSCNFWCIAFVLCSFDKCSRIIRFDLEKALTKNERLERQLSEAVETSRYTLSPSEHSTNEGGEKCVSETGPSSITTTNITSVVGGIGDSCKMSAVPSEEVNKV